MEDPSLDVRETRQEVEELVRRVLFRTKSLGGQKFMVGICVEVELRFGFESLCGDK